MRRLLILGAQGSGKGTQANMLEQELGLAQTQRRLFLNLWHGASK